MLAPERGHIRQQTGETTKSLYWSLPMVLKKIAAKWVRPSARLAAQSSEPTAILEQDHPASPSARTMAA
jgi:hypothetical protein